MNSTKKTARLAGLFWFLSAVTGGFGLFYVRSNLVVTGDAAATAANVIASESLFRAAIVSNLFSQLFLFFFGLTLFHLLKEVNKGDYVLDSRRIFACKGARTKSAYGLDR